MRVINLLPHPQHFSYATPTKGGRTLKPGESSPALPFELITNRLVWQDLHSGKITLRLDETDRSMIKSLLFEDAKPIKVQELPKPPPKPAKPAPRAPRPPKAAASHKATPKDPRLKETESRMYPGRELSEKPTCELSLADLQRQNALVDQSQKSTKEEVAGFLGGKV